MKYQFQTRRARATFVPGERALRLADEARPLSARGSRLLATLIDHHGRILPKTDLVRMVWSGVHVGLNSVEVEVSKIRAALGERGINDGTIRTRRDGYMFAVAVTRVVGARELEVNG